MLSMRLSKLSRTHLAYQFIILTLVSLWIAHNEFLIDRKYIVLLGLVPVFLYQLVTISWCSELLPESQRSCISEVLFDTTTESGIEDHPKEQTEKNQESKDPKKDPENVKDAGESTQSPQTEIKQSRTYKFRGWQRSPSSPPAPFNATDAEKTFPRFTWSTDETKEPDSTKRYYFPYRQKRPEEWIDPTGLNRSRSCKIKPRVSNIDEQDEENGQAAPDETNEDSVLSGSPKIKKSYTFPRQTRRTEKTEASDDPVVGMPLIPNKEYLAEARKKTRRRRSVSISHLKTVEQEQLNYRKHQEFSQSVEVACPSNAERTNVSKMKSGFFSYFSKMRKENNDSKNSVKQRMRNLFQSRESLKMPGSEAGRCKSVAGDGEDFTYYPGYSLFDSDPFDQTDVGKEPSKTK